MRSSGVADVTRSSGSDSLRLRGRRERPGRCSRVGGPHISATTLPDRAQNLSASCAQREPQEGAQ